MCSLENACRTSTTSRLVLVCAVILIAASGLLCISRIHTSRPAMEENRAFSGKVRALSGIPEDHEVEFVAVNSVKGFPHKSRRLPGDLVPGSYHLKIHVNLKALTFGGSVVIRILCRRATSRIILHSRNIDLMGVLVRPAEASPHTDGMAVRRVLAFDKFQQVCIELDDPLIEGKHYAVQLNFKAKISDSLEGLYKSVYYNSSKHARSVCLVASHTNLPRGFLVDPFTAKSNNFKLLLQPCQKYYITQSEELGFSWLTQTKDDYTTDSHYLTRTRLLKGWEKVLFLVVILVDLRNDWNIPSTLRISQWPPGKV